MKRMIATLLAAAALAGCDGLVDLGDWTVGPGGTLTYGLTSHLVDGEVTVGPYPAEEGEATAYLYDPTDLESPLEEVPILDGRYEVDLGEIPGAEVCGYLVVLVRWDGITSETAPLFANPPRGCELGSPKRHEGTPFLFDPYPSLATPFRVQGRVFVDGEPAPVAGTEVSVIIRDPVEWRTPVDIGLVAEGRYEFETTDQAVRFALCRNLEALAFQPEGENDWAMLAPVDMETCGDSRTAPDIRLGQLRAAGGVVRVGAGGSPAAEGQATLQLLHPADSTAYGDAVTTHDDGSFQLWFPSGAESPGCDWLVRATLVDGAELIEAMPNYDGCTGDEWMELEFGVAGRGS